MSRYIYTRDDMARAWDEGYEEACHNETHGEPVNPYEQEKE